MDMTEVELEQLIKRSCINGVEEYRKQEKKERKRNNYHDTFALMKCYRDAVFHVENAISEGCEIENMPLTKQQQDTHLRSIRKTKFKTMLMLTNIDKAIEEIANRRIREGRAIEYKAFELYFMQGVTYQDIAEELNTSKNTPRRWISSQIKELSILLWGIEDIDKV